MCKLITIQSRQPLKGKDLDIVRSIIAAQASAIAQEPHGIAAIIHKANGTKIRRALKTGEYKDVLQSAIKDLEGATIGIIHTRTATTGRATEDNVHGWNLNGRYFAHNGHVSDFATWGGFRSTQSKTLNAKDIMELCQLCDDDGPCQIHMHLAEQGSGNTDQTDSYQFFNQVAAMTDEDEIAATIKGLGFYGIASMFDEASGTLYHMGTRPAPLFTDGKNWGVAFSYEPNRPRRTKRIAGWPVESKDRDLESIKEFEVPSGVFALKQ